MPKLKIAIIGTVIAPPHPAGTQIMQVIDHLSNEFEFTIFARSIDKRLQGKVKFVKVPIPLFKPLLLRYLVQYFLFGRLFKKKNLLKHFDIVHVIEASSPYGTLVTMQYCGEAAKELMRNGTVKYKGWRQLYYKVLLWSGTIMEKKLMHNKYLKGVIVPSMGLKNDILQYHSVREVSIIPNGVDMKQFKNAKAFRTDMRRQLKINDNEFVGIIAGLGDWERKGLGHIIDAVSIMGNDQVKILVIGGGNTDYYKNICIKKNIQNSFVFIGITRELEKYYGLSDFFILPTANEAWSVVTLMAAASGLPLLATKVNGVEDFIIEGKNGFFIERDGHDIAKKILQLKSGVIDIVGMGKKSALFAQAFDTANVAQQYSEYYQNFVNAEAKTNLFATPSII